MNTKNLLVALILLATTSVAIAQEKSTTESTFSWGPKVGVDLATPTTDENTIRSEVKSNYQLGLFLRFGKKFFIQPELYYAARKEKIEVGTTVTENKINSLRLPVMLGMRIFNVGVVSGHVMAGPSATYVLDENIGSGNVSFNKNNLNLSLTGGAGVDIIGLITLDVRYAVDLNDNTKNAIKQLSLDDGVNVTLGLKF